MVPYKRIGTVESAWIALTCEHASCGVPVEYDDLGLDRSHLQEHVGWDLGAGLLCERLVQSLQSTAVLGGVSRLVIDVNRQLADADLIVESNHGVFVPGNQRLSQEECDRRIRDFHEPYHSAVDEMIRDVRPDLLLSIHSFTPELGGHRRQFDLGVLFDVHAQVAEMLIECLMQQGFEVRPNQPYSGLDGLIYSARRHGQAHRIPYLEIEVNNALLAEDRSAAKVADRISIGLTTFRPTVATVR